MKKSKLRIWLISVLASVCALCLGVGALFGTNVISLRKSGNNFTVPELSCDETEDGHKQFTYGKTYTIGGKKYKLGEGEDECIDFHTALGLDASSYSVKLSRFIRHDGIEGDTAVTSLRSAGTYEFEIVPLASDEEPFIETIDVDTQKIDFSNASVFSFLNASDNSPLHGDVTTIYRNNAGWYPVQVGGEFTFESRAVTNSYVYQGRAITIKIDGEEGSELKYSGIDFNLDITNKTGTTFTASGEYVATYTIAIPAEYQEGYSFDYGDELKLSDSYKGLEITNRSAGSFVLTKHWFIVYDLPTIISKEGIANDPYVPFSLDGSATDTVTFGDEIVVNNPAISGDIDKDISFTFEIDYVSPDGVHQTLATRESGGDSVYNKYWASIYDDNPTYYNRIKNYINSSMPAGTYTLKVYGVYYNPSEHLVSGEYTLHVLPKSFYDEGAAVSAIQAIQNKLAGAGVVNRYELGSTEVLHTDISDEEQTLAGLLSDFSFAPPQLATGEANYWVTHTEYFDDSVEITYNREGQSRNNYVSLASMLSDLGTPNTYKFYYSISARNFIAVGGPDDSAREDYYFQTTLYESITDIYDYIAARSPYFMAARYTGSPVTVSVPTSFYYGFEYIIGNNKDGKDYIQVGKGASVTLTININQRDYYGWGALPEGLEDTIEDGVDFHLVDSTTLIVYFDIIKAENSWTVAPTMPPWAYSGFRRTVNTITSKLTYEDNTTAYYRIGTQTQPAQKDGLTWLHDESSGYYWLSVGGSYTVKEDGYDASFFTVTGNQVAANVEALLKKLDAGSYYLGSYVVGNTNVEDYEPTSFSPITILTTTNGWDVTPGMTGWLYNGFSKDNFRAGEDIFKEEFSDNDGSLTYKVYNGDVVDAARRGELGEVEPEVELSFDREDLDNDTFANLNKLEVATYTFVAVRKGTDNYPDLVSAVTFRVTKATDAWQNGKVPAISGWMYNQFTAGLFTDGEGNFGTTTTYTVHYTDGRGEASDPVDGYKGTRATLVEVLNDLPVGSYVLRAATTTVDNSNFFAAEIDIRFSVTKASYHWESEEPTMGSWLYGSTDDETKYKPHTEVKVIYYVNETPYPFEGEITIEYYSAELNSSNEWVKVGDKKYDDSDIETASAGEYVMVITVEDSDNYEHFEYSWHFTVSKSSNSWGTAPDGYLSWAWGDLQNEDRLAEFKESGLFNVSAQHMNLGDTYTVTYAIVGTDPTNGNYRPDPIKVTVTVKDGDEHEHDADGIAELIKALDMLPVGNYRITVTIGETDNFASLQDVTTVSVSKATFIWDSEPSDDGWAWGDSEETKNAKIVTPAAHTAKNNTVIFQYKLEVDGEQRYSGNSFDSVRTALLSGKEGVYEITIVPDDGDGEQYGYSLNNYATFTKIYVITITQSANGWVEGKGPNSSYTYEYGNIPAGLPENFEALHGTVLYCSDATLNTKLVYNGAYVEDFATFLNYLRSLAATDSSVPHIVYIGVKEAEKEYEGVLETVELNVTGIRSIWDNEGEFKADYPLTYEEGLDFADVVLPKHVSGGTTTYTISYTNYLGENPNSGEAFTAEDAIAWLVENAAAGTYIINIEYIPDIASYTTLNYTVTVTVARAKTAWESDPNFNTAYDCTYGSVAVVEPTLSKDSYYLEEMEELIKITVLASNGSDAQNADGLTFEQYGKSLAEFLKTLNIGTEYTIKWELEGDENYEGITAQCRLDIRSVINNWLTASDGTTSEEWMSGQHGWTITRGTAAEDYTVIIPEATVGNETLVITFNGDDITSELGFEEGDDIQTKTRKLNEYLYSLDLLKGSYPIVFTIAQTINYNGRSSNCTITVINKTNSWADGKTLSDYTGTTVPDTFYIPSVTVNNELLRFDVTSAGNKVNEQPLNAEELKALLATLQNGTFVINAYIGGTDYELEGLEEYNKNYDPLSCTCTLYLSPDANDWTNADDLTGATWTYGSFDDEASELPRPLALHGNDTIVYTISGAGLGEGIIIDASKDYSSYGKSSKAENAFEAFKDELKKLHTGSYNVTITIAATADYTAPTPITRMFTVNQVKAAWDETTQGTNGNKTYNWTLLDEENEEVVAPVLDYETVKESDAWLKTARYTLTKDGATGVLYPSGSTSSWSGMMDVLNAQKAGTYYISVIIEGDTDHAELSYTVTVVINLAQNSWTEDTTGYGSSSMVDISWVFNSVSNQKIKFEAVHNNDNLTIQVNRTPVDYEELNDYLYKLGVGQHVIIAKVPADDTYTGLELTVRITVTRATNSWQDEIELSIGAVSESDSRIGWTWGDSESSITKKFVFPVASAGSFALVEVINVHTGFSALQATVYYIESSENGQTKRIANPSDIEALVRKLAALDVAGRSGDSNETYEYKGYTIKITVSETADYSALESDEVTFIVKTAKNDWSVKPNVGQFSYGGDIAYPSSLPYYGQGTVLYRYAKKVDGQPCPELDINNTEVWKETLSAEAGSYWIMGYVPAPDNDNYTDLYGSNEFYIGAGTNSWINTPGVREWSWDNYDKNVHLFSGSARSGGEATFTITGTGGKEDFLDLDISAYFLSSDDKFEVTSALAGKLRAFKYESGNIVSDEIEKILKALKPGNYLLWVTVAGGASLGPISTEVGVPFTVSKAANEWKTAPAVRNFTYGETDVLTAGVAKYGEAYYKIESSTYASEVITNSKLLADRISTLGAGSYELRAWVAVIDSDPYTNLYTQSAPYRTMFVISAATNKWVDGRGPASLITTYYAKIHNAEDSYLQSLIVNPVAVHGTDSAVFAILNSDYQVITSTATGTGLSNLTYSQLINQVKTYLTSGEYFLRITIPEDNYYVEFITDVVFRVYRYTSSFVELPDGLNGQWQADGNTSLTSGEISAQYVTEDGDNIDITSEVRYAKSKTTDSFTYEEFLEEIKSYESGYYTIIVTVAQTDTYDGVNETLQLYIAPATDEWLEDKQSNIYKPEDSLNASKKNSVFTWEWSNTVEWLQIKLRYGEKVVVWIASESAPATSLKNLTIEPANAEQRSLVSNFIETLDAGTYYLILATPTEKNWNGIGNIGDIADAANTKVKFTIEPFTNYWEEEPAFSINPVGGRYVWEYETNVKASAKAKWGEVEYIYYKGQTVLPEMPTDVGVYKVVFRVVTPDPYNYTVKSDELEFEITKKLRDDFTVNPGVTGWSWDNYSKENNLFLGTPKSGGAVEFAVIQKNGAGEVTKEHVKFSLDGTYAPDSAISVLNDLPAGQYYLKVSVSATENYLSFTDDSFSFTIDEAANTWKKTPQMMSWSFGNWTEKSAPTAEPKYFETKDGEIKVKMWITSNVTGETIVTGKYLGEGKFEVDKAALSSAEIGLYTMHVLVERYEGYFSEINEETVTVEVYVQGSPDEGNFWIQFDMPHMNDWIAEIDTVNLPTGRPARGQAYFIFYKAERNEAGQWVKADKRAIGSPEWGEEGPEYKIIPAGTMYGDDCAYARDLYIPMEPGDYLMYGCAVNLAAPGKDDLGEDSANPARFTIYNREIAWDQSVTIDSLLYLGEYYHGDRENWGAHSATTTIIGDDVKIRYEYYGWNEETFEYDIPLGEDIPIEPGKYMIKAYAKAKYTAEITSSMKFEVCLSQNAWKGGTSPSIGSWSEEYNSSSPNPEGQAEHGTITYTYENKKTGQIYYEKPTKAGTYILHATVEYDGYAPLTATYEFTISPAFDMTFLIICIVLGALAIVILFVVIFFAVRRHREN